MLCSGGLGTFTYSNHFGPIKCTIATLSVRKNQQCQKTPTTEEPDYCHRKGPISRDRIVFGLMNYWYYINNLTLVEQKFLESRNRKALLRLTLKRLILGL